MRRPDSRSKSQVIVYARYFRGGTAIALTLVLLRGGVEMNIPMKVVIRDCVAVVAILLCVASAAAQAQGPVLASYRICAVSQHGACARDQAQPCPASARTEQQEFLQWAVAMHRAVVSDSGIALRTVKPATVPVNTEARVTETAARTIACSH
jgi:hypothetical protein